MLSCLALIGGEEDRRSFQAVYEDNYILMYHVALGILKHPADAENAVHGAFLSMAERFEKYKGLSGSDLKGLCVTIVKHKAIDILRERNRWSERQVEELVLYNGDGAAEPEASCLKKEENRRYSRLLREAMGRLPEVFAQALELKYYYGFGNREIARLMDVSVKTVEMRLYRAKKKLRELLEGEFDD